MKITTKEVKNTVNLLDELVEEYKEESIPKKRDWRTYEDRLAKRLKTAFQELRPLVEEAINTINITKGENRGAKPILSLEQKVLVLLLKHLIDKSNREMAVVLIAFSLLAKINVSYKTIERLYSDHEVILILHNLHTLILKKKGIKEVDATGDGTGYGLTIKKHYASEAQKLKDKIKEGKTQNKKTKKSKAKKKLSFVYSFAIMDIKTRMYIAYGTSFKSEKEAFLSTLEMLDKLDIKINSLRLDRYFQQAYVKYIEEKFGKVKFYIIPKKNATVRGSWGWKRMLFAFVNDTKGFLKEYFKRNQSESGFAEDKRRIGWRLGQKREDRIDTANILTALWHNMYWLAD